MFGHKNEASAAMVAVRLHRAFRRSRAQRASWRLIVVSAVMFLFFTQSKTSIAMLPLVLIISAIMARVRRPAIGIAHRTFGCRDLQYFFGRFDLFRAGEQSARFGPDGFDLHRTNRNLAIRFGHVRNARSPDLVLRRSGELRRSFTEWADTQSGQTWPVMPTTVTSISLSPSVFPGQCLSSLWLVVLPLIDFYRSPRDPSAIPLEMLFLRVCLFAAYESCFESMLLQEGGAALFLFAATFGLRLISISRVRP